MSFWFQPLRNQNHLNLCNQPDYANNLLPKKKSPGLMLTMLTVLHFSKNVNIHHHLSSSVNIYHPKTRKITTIHNNYVVPVNIHINIHQHDPYKNNNKTTSPPWGEPKGAYAQQIGAVISIPKAFGKRNLLKPMLIAIYSAKSRTYFRNNNSQQTAPTRAT